MAFLDTLKSLSLTKKLMAAGAIGAVLLAMSALVQTASKPPMALLYAGVDAGAAAEIVTTLDAENVIYEIDGERIYVEAPERDRLRLTLAREGLPKQSVAGYELLDELSGFSTTSDMFTAAYWRAKEGELTRTILTIPGVRAARVHIGADERTAFSHNRTPRTASVTVTAPGGLSSSQVKAIQHLVALSVSNLRPDSVAVVETQMGLLSDSGGDAAAAASMDEDKRARSLEQELTRLLEARVGRGRARVSVAMRLSREREAISEQIIDPDTAVVTNRTTSESRETESGTDKNVTVASELPDGDVAAGESNAERTESREEVSYAMTTRDRTVERLPGQIERLTIAVLIDGVPAAEDGADPEPRTAEELAALQELVEVAAGVDPARGDRVTVQSLNFDQPATTDLVEADSATNPIAGMESKLWQVGQLAFLGIVALVLGLFVVKPILTQGSSGAAASAAGGTLMIDDPITMLRVTSDEEPDAAAALLNAWLEEDEAA
ncbi:flagellar basal-body MS-ring/collar protein FliF [Parvularcula sp. LCG005]|uniref:flagellar basal-body MS-ring/collar protein FliF n=1 Tax=Parvularcula sp. LCG005 TaxID=3078805 RepID=UPI002942332A|nr:flagellar basal-body MS-ring/collar protein FliF [Parvularcula sp. LCG005]WOI52930.1 flagellar basal-body MS-ring/collar protein FliF [Parvularcula sp. LCG005]